jgi:hypothetical protein
MPNDTSTSAQGAPRPDAIAILLEEYRQMYALALYRLNALDQRVPLATGAITTVLACAVALTPTLQVGLLIGLLISVLWLFRTTVNHARSFEDALRRIEEIERAVNDRARALLLAFQSTHPSRGVQVGGRTGKETVDSVLVVSSLLLGWCLAITVRTSPLPVWSDLLYTLYVVIVCASMVHLHRMLRDYRYCGRSY